MARRQYKTPFAATGDVVSVPDAVQPDGSVSMQQGYGFDYQRDPDTDQLAKVIPRDVHNGILNEITASIGEIQQNGYPIWVVEGAPYPINAVVRHNNVNWQSNIATNNDEPGVGAGATSWKVAGASVERFNAPIATIASAETVNLTTGAPDTSQVTITGSTTITGFTVAAGRAFVVKFTGSPILTNNAAIVTGRGANIPVVAGDSFLMRSTAANTVEIVGGSFLADRAVGSGQTLQSLAASRAINTTYTNTTGRTIFAMASISVAAGSSGVLQLDGTSIGQFANNGTGSTVFYCAFPVKDGMTYRIQGGTAVAYWGEFR